MFKSIEPLVLAFYCGNARYNHIVSGDFYAVATERY